MNKRYKITRLDEQENATLTLEQCIQFFESQEDFKYSDQYVVQSNGTQMTIPGHFFMWQIGETSIPFRFFEGEIYVAISHPIIFDKMVQLTEQLEAVYIEG